VQTTFALKENPDNMDSQMNGNPSNGSSDEIDILAYWDIICKRKKLLFWITTVLVSCTVIGSLFLTDIYEAQAVITPVASPAASTPSSSSSLSSLASQFGGLASMIGISLPGGSSTSEISALLNSNILREKIINRYNLLPIIFHDKWDPKKNDWEELNIFKKAVNAVVGFIRSHMPGVQKQKKDFFSNPTVWDGLREFGDDGDIITITTDATNNTITISADMDDPEVAAKVVNYFVETLTDHMSSESRRVAETNRKYLEEQKKDAVDPATRQKIYTLLSQQVETILMSAVKENFAFKVLDPPKAPDKKKKPKRSLFVALSFILSIFIGFFTVFILDYVAKQRARKQSSTQQPTS
jgi:uncharacterized protein involved in exopolysaccharide biosynthesis